MRKRFGAGVFAIAFLASCANAPAADPPTTRPQREGIVGIGIGSEEDLRRATPTYLGLLFLQQSVSEIGLDDDTRTKAASIVTPAVKSAYDLVAVTGNASLKVDTDKAAWDISRHVQGQLAALLSPSQMDKLDKQDSIAFIQFYRLASNHDETSVVAVLEPIHIVLTGERRADVRRLLTHYEKAVAQPHTDPTNGYYEWPLLLELRAGLRRELTAEQVKALDDATVKAAEDERDAEMKSREQTGRATTRPLK